MRATVGMGRVQTWRKLGGLITASVLALSVFGGTAQGANTRNFGVMLSDPTPASQGAATKFDVTVSSGDNQTIANVVLSLPGVGLNGVANPPWPNGITISAVFGVPSGACSSTHAPESVKCDLGNFDANATKTISVLAAVSNSVSVGNSIIFYASAETNNENGTNNQVVFNSSRPLSVIAFNANSLRTANETGGVATSGFEIKGSGNLQTKVNVTNYSGLGNAIGITEGIDKKQPTYCTEHGLVCQSDFTDVTVNGGEPVSPSLETVLFAKVPGSYRLIDAFVIHFLPDGVNPAPGFPLYSVTNPLYKNTSCVAHPELVPCADFTLSNNIVMITVHTPTNGVFKY